MSDALTLLQGDCREVLKALPDASVHCCVTSPPYWGLRDYGHSDQIGLEPTPQAYVETMRQVFGEVRRVLRDDGTLWLNLGDSYASDPGKGGSGTPNGRNNRGEGYARIYRAGSGRADGIVDERGQRNRDGVPATHGLKAKDLIGIPWRVALALQADGWYLRSDIIWAKPNPMPESVTDRPTRSHEYLFLLAKSARYYYDAGAIAERVARSQVGRVREDVVGGVSHVERGQHSKGGTYRGSSFTKGKTGVNGNGRNQPDDERKDAVGLSEVRNKRDVWTVPTSPYKDAHFATYPPDLIRPCILAGCPVGGVVLDPFFGSGTTGMVALETGRRCIGIELNASYCDLAKQRCDVTLGLPL